MSRRPAGQGPRLTLKEIKDVLDLQRCGKQPGERVTGILDAGIDRELADLRCVRRAAGTARQTDVQPWLV